jgi:uracil-DNA glycosylase family 4
VPPRQPPRDSYRRPTASPKLPIFGAEPPPPPPPQTWAEFLQGWGRGCGSNLCPLARKVVLARGTLPCDVLFIGEAPGVSEDVTGRPFVGPAGSLLDHIVATALAPEGTPTCTVAFTNLVGCMPHADPDSGATFREPTPDEIKACKPRLEDFIDLADPQLIVCVGALARDWLDEKRRYHVRTHRPVPMVDIPHPAAILRANVAQQSLLVQRCIVTIANAADAYVRPRPPAAR